MLLFLLTAWFPSLLKVRLYRLLGANIGKKVSLEFGSFLLAKSFSKICIGDYTTIRAFTLITCAEIWIGKYSEIGVFAWIWGAGKLQVGDKCYIGPRVIINLRRNDFIMGNYAGVGPGSVVYTHGMFLPYTSGWPRKFADIVMEDYTWVPAKVLILPGVRIGKKSMIGSGAVVTKSIPPGTFAAGVPAKVISEVEKFIDNIDEAELRRRILEIILDLIDFYSLGMQIENLPDNSFLIAIEQKKFLKKKLYRILITNAQAFSREKVLELATKDNFILLSTSDIPVDLQDKLQIWFDLKNLKCGDISDDFVFKVWDFMRREWCVTCDVTVN